MSTRLMKLEKKSRRNKFGKCDWSVELMVDGEWTQKMYFIKYTKDALIDALKETCNCTIPREFVR